MNSFRNQRLRNHALPMSTAWLFNDIAEAKGKQELYTRQSPHVLKALREMALIQSVESSNRIEGVTVAPNRLRPLVLGQWPARCARSANVQGIVLTLTRATVAGGASVSASRLVSSLAPPKRAIADRCGSGRT